MQLALLHAIRYDSRVVRIEEPQGNFSGIVRSRADLGEGVGRITLVPPGVSELVPCRGVLDLISCTSLGSVENAPRTLRAWYMSRALNFEKSDRFCYQNWTTGNVLHL